MIQKLRCKLGGHDWSKRPVASVLDANAIVGVCDRCGLEAKVSDVMKMGGRPNPPRELLDQDDVDKVRARYRDGHLGEEEFELAIAAAMGDEEAADEYEAKYMDREGTYSGDTE